MIVFRQMGIIERIKRALSPAYRKRRDDELKQAIRELVSSPSKPCIIDGVVVRDGYGGGPQWKT